MVTYS